MRGNEALNTLPWVVGGVNGLERGVCLSEGSVRDGSAQEGEIQQRQGGCAGLGLIAVNQQGTRGGVLLRCEGEKCRVQLCVVGREKRAFAHGAFWRAGRLDVDLRSDYGGGCR